MHTGNRNISALYIILCEIPYNYVAGHIIREVEQWMKCQQWKQMETRLNQKDKYKRAT